MAKAKFTPEQKKALYKRIVEEYLPRYLADEFPAMGNETPEALVDEVGMFKELEGELTALIKVLHNIIDSKMHRGQVIVTGDNFEMVLSEVTQNRLDNDLAKAELEKIGKLQDCIKTTTFNQHRYTIKPKDLSRP